MQISIFNESFEEKIPSQYSAVKYKIIYPRTKYPVRTEAEGRLNDELIAIALSKRSYIRSIAEEMQKSHKVKKEYVTGYSFEMRPTYVDGMFVSFLCESIMTTNTTKTDITYSAKTYRISSAQHITLEKLFRHPHIKPVLWEKLTQNAYDIFTKASYEDFLAYYRNTDYYLTSEGIVIFFPPNSIIGGYKDNIHVTIKYEELKGVLKYQFT